jgi:hypothetical protein
VSIADQIPRRGLRGLLSRHAAALYGMAGRLWLVLTGPITVIVLATHLTPFTQGYFFTFISLAAARTMAELGLGQVIIVKMAQLSGAANGGIVELSPRSAGFVRFTAKWFAGAGFIVGALLCLGGTLLLAANDGLPRSEWLPQWIALGVLSGFEVALSGLLFPLEGAGHVRSVYFCRMIRSFVNSLVLWVAILADLHLWSISIALACSLVWMAYFLLTRAALVVEALRPGATVAKVDWQSEVLPAQWRLALSSLAEYLSFYTIVPLTYVIHGAVVAGQLGVTWQIAAAISAIAGAIVSTRFQEFSRLAGARSFRQLDGLLVSTSLVTMSICLLGALAFAVCVFLLERSGLPIADRLLPLNDVLILMAGMLIWHSNLTLVSYLRAHGGDPFLPASLSGAVLLFVVNLTLGRWFGPEGLLSGYALMGACFMVPLGLYLLLRLRRSYGYPPFKVDTEFVSLSWNAKASRH